MTLALWCLAIGCVLPYVWSMATFPGRFQEGALDSHHPRAQAARLQGPYARAVAAHENAWEALPVFAAGVLTAHVTGADPAWSANLAIAWVVCRTLHGVVYMADIPAARSAMFLGAYACALGQFALAAQAS